QPVQLAVLEQARRVQGTGVCTRAGQVVGHQPPVEVRRARQRLELGAGTTGEPAAPELALVGARHQSVPDSMAAWSRSSLPSASAAGLRVIRSPPPASISPSRAPFSTSTWPWSSGCAA